MVAIKVLGVIITFYLFVIFEAFGQNFYPARYGKRNENDSYQDKNLSENRRIGRSENQDAMSRKVGFFISGGRFGKRVCSENCFEKDIKSGSKEIISSGFQNRQDRSERIRIPSRKNQFMIGSRFGKRMGERIGVTDSAENINSQNLKCIFIGISDLYKCLEMKQFSEEGDAIEYNSSSEFLL